MAEDEDALSYGASEEEQWLGEEEAKGAAAQEAQSKPADNTKPEGQPLPRHESIEPDEDLAGLENADSGALPTPRALLHQAPVPSTSGRGGRGDWHQQPQREQGWQRGGPRGRSGPAFGRERFSGRNGPGGFHQGNQRQPQHPFPPGRGHLPGRGSAGLPGPPLMLNMPGANMPFANGMLGPDSLPLGMPSIFMSGPPALGMPGQGQPPMPPRRPQSVVQLPDSPNAAKQPVTLVLPGPPPVPPPVPPPLPKQQPKQQQQQLQLGRDGLPVQWQPPHALQQQLQHQQQHHQQPFTGPNSPPGVRQPPHSYPRVHSRGGLSLDVQEWPGPPPDDSSNGSGGHRHTQHGRPLPALHPDAYLAPAGQHSSTPRAALESPSASEPGHSVEEGFWPGTSKPLTGGPGIAQQQLQQQQPVRKKNTWTRPGAADGTTPGGSVAKGGVEQQQGVPAAAGSEAAGAANSSATVPQGAFTSEAAGSTAPAAARPAPKAAAAAAAAAPTKGYVDLAEKNLHERMAIAHKVIEELERQKAKAAAGKGAPAPKIASPKAAAAKAAAGSKATAVPAADADASTAPAAGPSAATAPALESAAAAPPPAPAQQDQQHGSKQDAGAGASVPQKVPRASEQESDGQVPPSAKSSRPAAAHTGTAPAQPKEAAKASIKEGEAATSGQADANGTSHGKAVPAKGPAAATAAPAPTGPGRKASTSRSAAAPAPEAPSANGSTHKRKAASPPTPDLLPQQQDGLEDGQGQPQLQPASGSGDLREQIEALKRRRLQHQGSSSSSLGKAGSLPAQQQQLNAGPAVARHGQAQHAGADERWAPPSGGCDDRWQPGDADVADGGDVAGAQKRLQQEEQEHKEHKRHKKSHKSHRHSRSHSTDSDDRRHKQRHGSKEKRHSSRERRHGSKEKRERSSPSRRRSSDGGRTSSKRSSRH